MLKKFLPLIVLIICSMHTINAQSNTNNASNYNIPPGFVLQKKVKIIDYRYKLNSISSAKNTNADFNAPFTSHFKEVDLKEVEANDPALFDYYTKANIYYSQLSNRVKSTFSLEELWHIYFFDQGLKDQLQSIK